MREPILYDPIKYVINIAEIVDSFDGEKFMDTSMIITPPISLYDPEKKEYKGVSLGLLSSMLKFYSNTAKYNRISSDIIKNVNAFYDNLLEIINPDIMITPEVFAEIKKSNKHQDMLTKKTEEMYRIKTRGVFYKGTARKKTAEYISKNNPSIPFRIGERFYKMNKSKIHKIKKTMDEILSTEKKSIEQVMNSSMTHVNVFKELDERYSDIYENILDVTTEAFERYKKRSNKNHNNSSDHKILAETILYSHLLGKKILFLTADNDYKHIAMEMKNLEMNNPLSAKVVIVDRVTPKNHHVMPYFEKACTITYNGGFKVEHKAA